MSNHTNIPGWPKMTDMGGSANNLNNAFSQGMAGGLDFMKNFWGNNSSGIPGFVVPTIDLKELEKRIKDLKAVEGWLDVNINMLRSTIQALEVQHNTIATIHAMSDSISHSTADVAAAMTSHSSASTTPAPATTRPLPFTNPFASQPEPVPVKVARKRKPVSKPHVNSGLPPGWPTLTPSAESKKPASHAAPIPLRVVADAAAIPVTHGAAPTKTNPKTRSSAKTASKALPAAPASSTVAKSGEQAAASAGAWLNFLQDQFNKVATTAIGNSAVKSAAKKPAARPTKKMAGKVTADTPRKRSR